MDVNVLNLQLAGLDLKSPTILASGIMGYSVKGFQRMAKAGVGAVVTKSIGLKPREGYDNPTIVQASSGLINAMGLPNPGIINYIHEISEAKKILSIPFIVSIYGFSTEEYKMIAHQAIKAGADAIELNVSCPHVKCTGSEVGQNIDLLKQVISGVKSKITKPVIVKLSPNVTNIANLAEVAVEAGADIIAAINTIRAMAIDIVTKKPVLSNVFGGLSGPAIKPIALRCVYEIYEKVNAPIIGCGGITDWRDAIEFILAGASAVQIGTAIALKNQDLFMEINKGIKKYLLKNQIRSLNQIVGLSHKK